MRLFGSIRELVAAVFRKDSKEITLRPNLSVTYGSDVDVELPAQTTNAVLVSRNSVDTLTNKNLSDSTTFVTDATDATVKIGFNAAGTTNTTTTLVSSQTANRTITLPNVTGTVVTTGDTGTVTSTMIANGTIVDADINASAAIAYSKLASLTSGNILVGSATNVPTSTAVTGDVTISNTGVTAIAAGAIVNADVNAAAAIDGSKIQAANGTTNAGVVSTSAQDFGGVKTFLSNPIMSGLTASQAVVTDASKNLASLGYDSANTASTLVQRDASGNFSAGTITASLSGNASTATSATSFSGSLAGDVSGTQGATSVNRIRGRTVNATAPTNAQTLVWNNTTSEWTPVSISGDVTMTNAGSVQIASGAIVNADVSASAAIAGSKIAPDFGAQTVKTTGTVDTNLLTTSGTATLLRGVISGTGQNGYIEMTGQTVAGFPAPSVSTNARLFAGSDGKLYGYNGGGAAPFQLGAGTGGSGEINAVSNPSANDDTSGWTAGTSHTVTRDTSNSPLSGIVSTAFDLSSSAAIALGSQTSTSGVYDAITMPTGLRNRKLKVEFYYTTPASSAGTWAVAIYKGATKVALSTDSSGDTILPSSVTGGKFTAYFDTDSASAYSLNLVQRSRTGANDLYITNVIVGPGIQPQGAVVGEWTSYTPTFSGTNATTTGFWRRNGSNIDLSIKTVFTGTPGASSRFTWALPSGLTIDTSKITTGDEGHILGSAHVLDSGLATYNGYGVLANNSTSIYTQGSGAGTDIDSAYPISFAVNDIISVDASVPIAEWAGSGTLTVAQNDVSYYYGTGGTWGTTGTLTTGQGPGGVLGGTTTPAGTYFQWTIVPTAPIQVGSQVVFEASVDGQRWTTVPSNAFNNGSSILEAGRFDGTSTIGVSAGLTSTGNILLTFGKYTSSAGGTWSSLSTWYWRIKVTSAGAAVGFGIVQPGTSAGLVSASGLPGNTTGNAIASGYVGESYEVAVGPTAPAASNTAYNVGFVDVPAGRWKIEATGNFLVGSGLAGNGYVIMDINTTSATTRTNRLTNFATNGGNNNIQAALYSLDINVSTTTRVYLVAVYNYTSVGTSNVVGYIKYTRIA